MFKSKLLMGLLFALFVALLVAQMAGPSASAQLTTSEAGADEVQEVEQEADAPVVHVVDSGTSVGAVLGGGGSVPKLPR